MLFNINTWYTMDFWLMQYFIGKENWTRVTGLGLYLDICRYTYSISQEIWHGFVVLCFVVVMQSFIMNSHEAFIHIHQGCFAGTGAIVRLPQCQWSKPDGYGKISQCITTTKQKPCAYFLGYTVYRHAFPIFYQEIVVHVVRRHLRISIHASYI